MFQDYKLGLRMLAKHPGLTLAGGIALAIAIGIGTGWYDVMHDFFRPRLPLPDGDRIVEIEMRNPMIEGDERRLAHDFMTWRREVRTVVDLGAYRSIERNLVVGTAPPVSLMVAETTASAFRLARVPPLLGRPLIEADEQPGAPPVAVIGHGVWQQQFGGRTDVVGQTVHVGTLPSTIVGVMPEGFAFPVNHRLWVPLPLRASGYAPLEGPAIRVFGRLAPDASQTQANVELVTVTQRLAADFPQAYEHLSPRVLAYGGESPGDSASWIQLAVTHLPILLVLIIACTNVGTLIYARTATREAEIATRYALGAGRWRIVSQLFVEALVLAAVAAVVGLAAAHWAVRWGVTAFYSRQVGGAPFWVDPGLNATTVLYAATLTIGGAAILGVLPALKVVSPRVHEQLRNTGAGGSTLRFGMFWTTAMIVQVALTVICLPPAVGISSEALRDRAIRAQFPTREYLALRIELDRGSTYGELERRLEQEPGVLAVTYADRLPGMGPSVRTAEVEITSAAPPVVIPNLWSASVGAQFFETFGIPLLTGRDFHEGDRTGTARTVLVNEAFARRYLKGANPVGTRVRYASTDPARPQPWFEIIGMVRDVGMTPTDLGEAPYIFTPASLAATSPLIVGVRIAGDPTEVASRVRPIVAGLDVGLRLHDVRSLEELAWSVDVPAMVGAGAIGGVIALGLFMSAAGIFSLMAVNVARKTREIGLRTALGAGRGRLLVGVFSRALMLIGSGIAADNLVLLLIVGLSPEVDVLDVYDALLMTSAVMLTVGLLACIEPARRALRIQPIDALKEA